MWSQRQSKNESWLILLPSVILDEWISSNVMLVVSYISFVIIKHREFPPVLSISSIYIERSFHRWHQNKYLWVNQQVWTEKIAFDPAKLLFYKCLLSLWVWLGALVILDCYSFYRECLFVRVLFHLIWPVPFLRFSRNFSKTERPVDPGQEF